MRGTMRKIYVTGFLFWIKVVYMYEIVNRRALQNLPNNFYFLYHILFSIFPLYEENKIA